MSTRTLRSHTAIVTAALVVGAVALAGGCPSQVATGGKTPKPDPNANEPPHFFADPPFGIGFDCIELGCDTEKSLTIQNKGGGSLGISKVRLSVDSSVDYSLRRADGGAMPTPDAQVFLAVGEELELVVRYRPSDGSLDAGEVQMEHYDAATAYEDAAPKTDEVPLTARAIGSPVAGFDGAVLDFGYVPVGTEATLDVVIDNAGDDQVLAVGPAHREDGTPGVFHAPSPREWGLRFANPGAAAHIPVVFSPDVADAFFGAVVLQTNDPALPGVRVSLQGTSIADARMQLVSPTDGLTLPPLRSGDSVTRDVVIRNAGGTPLDVNAAISAGGNAGLTVDPPGVTQLAPLASASFHVSLTGQAGGFVDGTLSLFDVTADTGGATIDVPVHAAVDAPFLAVAPEPLQFGAIVQGWTAPAQQIQIANVGFGDLTVNTIAFEVGSSSQISIVDVPPLPQKLSPGDAPLVVTVLMQAQNLGSVDAVLLVGSDSIDDPVHRVNMHGDVITCEQGCPIPNGQPDCSSGRCEIGGCNAHFHDPDGNVGDGCECIEDIVGNNVADIGQACPGLNIGTLHDGNDGGTRSTTRNGTLHANNDADLYSFHATDDGCFLCGDNYGADVTLTGPAGMQLCANFQESGNGCGGLPTNCRTIGGGGGSVTIRGNGQSGIFGSSDNSEDVTVFVLWPGGNGPPVCGNYSLFMRADGNF